ncbi:hypothetical protein F5Y19DRAFT_479182 [Xylariaceae sp. FL1651]|nr:hypothetical protein F5Y19DRAFT_479182 [Xylariaceae sp. FL1651]
MGRWGMHQDLDVAIEFNGTFGEGGEGLELFKMISQTYMIAPQDTRVYYKTDEYAKKLDLLIADNRQKLDTDGLGDQLMAHWHARENTHYG